MLSTEATIGAPSNEEQLLIAMRDGAYEAASATMIAQLAQGESPRMLSVARPEILYGMADILLPATLGQPVQGYGYKADLFTSYVMAAEAGDPAAITALPKFATSLGELSIALQLAMDYRDVVTSFRDGRLHVQHIGSFNPMHVGHRTTIDRTLTAAGPNSEVMAQAVADHPKKSDLPPYRQRLHAGEQKIYSSTMLDPTRVSFIDVPLSLGLAKVGTAQIRLIADVTGDEKMRWQLGSDKFMTDVHAVQKGKELDKAGARFGNVHLYVARRDTESLEDIEKGIDYLRDTFGTEVTLLPETEDELVLSAAASKIRAMRASGNRSEADVMEFRDIHPAAVARLSQELGY